MKPAALRVLGFNSTLPRRPLRFRTPHVATNESVSTPAPIDLSDEEVRDLVQQVLKKIERSDAGQALTGAEKKEIDEKLELIGSFFGARQDPRPLDDPNIFGNYVVAYSSPGSNQYGEPAGGRFRSQLGKLLCTTEGLFQSVLAPAIVVNKVAFRILGLIRGSISLRGTFREFSEPIKTLTPNRDTVKVYFDPPRLNFGPVSIEIGGFSTVVLATTYLSEDVRIGKGSRGSYFVFTKGGASDQAEMDKVGTQPPSGIFKAIGSAFILSGLAYTLNFTRVSYLAGNALSIVGGALGFLVFAGLAWVSWRGGQYLDEDERVKVEAAKGRPAGERHPDLKWD